MTKMTTVAALSAAMEALSYLNQFYTTTQCDPNGEPLMFDPAEAMERLGEVKTQLENRSAKAAAKRAEKKDANKGAQVELFGQAVDLLTGHEPMSMGDMATALEVSTAKLSAAVHACNGGQLVANKVKGKLMWSVVGE